MFVIPLESYEDEGWAFALGTDLIPIELTNGTFGRRAALRAPWQPSFNAVLRNNNVAELELNYALGWRGNNIDFLAGINDLLAVSLTNWGLSNIGGLNELTQVRSLEINASPKAPLDFSRFAHLRRAYITWDKHFQSIFECNQLEALSLTEYRSDAKFLSRFTSLISLTLLDSSLRDVTFLRAPCLRHLRVGLLPLLNSLAGIEQCPGLRQLDVSYCKKLNSINGISFLADLTSLNLDDCSRIDSLSPIMGLQKLQSISFVGSTNIGDGELTPLMRLPELRQVNFANRKHYSHNTAQFPRIPGKSWANYAITTLKLEGYLFRSRPLEMD